MLDIIMYHYVRPIIGSEYPKIKGLEVSGFKRQLEYFSKERSVVSTSDVLKAVEGDLALPKDAVWLTFDDGYKDHFDYALPLLEQFGFDGAFFPVSDCYVKNQVLDVNKIQFILALAETDDLLLENLRDEMFGEGYGRSDWDNFWVSVDTTSGWDIVPSNRWDKGTNRSFQTAAHTYHLSLLRPHPLALIRFEWCAQIPRRSSLASIFWLRRLKREGWKRKAFTGCLVLTP